MRTPLPLLLAAAALVAAGCVAPPSLQQAPDAPDDEAHRLAASPGSGGSTFLEHVARAGDVPRGAGIWVDGGYAYVSGYGSGFHVVDVRDPTRPAVIGQADGFSRDVDLLKYGDGRRVAVTAGEREGMTFIDVTDPTSPTPVGRFADVRTHNMGVLPGTTYVYNADTRGMGSKNVVIDASDPANPKEATRFGTYGCHDITFFDDGAKRRLVCAGVERTELWDLADPLAPTLVGWVTNPAIHATGTVGVGMLVSPGLHHFALLDERGETLIIGDEFAGALANGCGANVDDTSTPLGAIWFYDVRGDLEKSPELLGWISPNRQGKDPLAPSLGGAGVGSCTAHFGDLVPGEDQLVIGWYRAGVLLIDFTDPAKPRVADQWRGNGVNAWDARVDGGHVFTGDLSRGLDVLALK